LCLDIQKSCYGNPALHDGWDKCLSDIPYEGVNYIKA